MASPLTQKVRRRLGRGIKPHHRNSCNVYVARTLRIASPFPAQLVQVVRPNILATCEHRILKALQRRDGLTPQSGSMSTSLDEVSTRHPGLVARVAEYMYSAFPVQPAVSSLLLQVARNPIYLQASHLKAPQRLQQGPQASHLEALQMLQQGLGSHHRHRCRVYVSHISRPVIRFQPTRPSHTVTQYTCKHRILKASSQ